jgi:tRNA (cmo5U34)-methyltransferase
MPKVVDDTNKDLWNPEGYDALRRQLIPSFDLLYDSAVRAVAAVVPSKGRMLDLGAGTGLLSAAISARLPDIRLVLVDRSESMLDQARQRFDGGGRVEFRVARLTDPLPSGKFDAVVSGLAIHHLSHEEKRDLFARIRDVLVPGGVFVNVEQILAPFPDLEAVYDSCHEEHVLAAATPAHEWAAGRERMRYDICADLESQLEWLRQAGFDQVDCLAKDWRFATYAAWTSGKRE